MDISKLDTSGILTAKKIFFIGAGGIGISALAKMAMARGMAVAGVNDEEGKTVDSLREAGAEIIFLKDFKELPQADMYIYSDAWLYRGPEIIEAARQTGHPVMSYFEALGMFANQYKVIAVAGTHGKTTTTAMIADVLIEAGLDPTVVVGSFVKKFNSNFRPGGGEYLVVEADEYNRHFLNFSPYLAVITNIEADHLDYYRDEADVVEAFAQLVAETEYAVVYDAGDPNSRKAVKEFGGALVDYGDFGKKVRGLSVPGEHNRQNAAAAMAAALSLGVAEDAALEALSKFSGTWRRLERIGETAEGAVIYDDYAHHPTEIRASLAALRELYAGKKLTVLFQPHLYSRTKAFFDEFAGSFGDADRVLLLPIYYAREDPDESVSSDKLAAAMAGRGTEAYAYPDFPGAEEAIRGLALGSGDVFVAMGAGEANKVLGRVFRLPG